MLTNNSPFQLSLPPQPLPKSHVQVTVRRHTAALLTVMFCHEIQSSQASKELKDESKRRALKASDTGFLQGLRARNVTFEGSVDPNDTISASILRESTSKTTEEEEKNWRIDVQESQMAGEATFQRTIMMEIINRHKLDHRLRYSCESIWTCQPMPRRKSESFDHMAAPKPDLAVSFRSSAVVDELRRNHLSYLTQYISPESLKGDKIDHAFHFFSMEVQTSSQDKIALRRNFNVASHIWTSNDAQRNHCLPAVMILLSIIVLLSYVVDNNELCVLYEAKNELLILAQKICLTLI